MSRLPLPSIIVNDCKCGRLPRFDLKSSAPTLCRRILIFSPTI